jgi:hypothetical protein
VSPCRKMLHALCRALPVQVTPMRASLALTASCPLPNTSHVAAVSPPAGSLLEAMDKKWSGECSGGSRVRSAKAAVFPSRVAAAQACKWTKPKRVCSIHSTPASQPSQPSQPEMLPHHQHHQARTSSQQPATSSPQPTLRLPA